MKRILTLGILVTGSFLSVFIGGLSTVDSTKYNNDFVRIFPSHAADVNSFFEMRRERLFLAGLSSSHIYLQDRRGILILNLNMKDTSRIDLDLSFGSELAVDSPFFYVMNASAATFQRGNINTCSLDTSISGLPRFTALQPISKHSEVIRSMNVGERKNILSKNSGHKQYILKKQVDGLLCTDGYLQYSEEQHQVVYTYRYRNQFICLDTNLNVVRFGKTIDTTSVAKIAVSEKDGKITMSKPPFAVNKGACVDGKYLFVNSNLMAKNESSKTFNDKSVVDVYNIIDGSYRFSFYVEKYKGKQMQHFVVKNTVLIAMFSNAIVRYDIPYIYLP